jgi:hypothetical protein
MGYQLQGFVPLGPIDSLTSAAEVEIEILEDKLSDHVQAKFIAIHDSFSPFKKLQRYDYENQLEAFCRPVTLVSLEKK